MAKPCNLQGLATFFYIIQQYIKKFDLINPLFIRLYRHFQIPSVKERIIYLVRKLSELQA
ncbi:hypothetical protein HMPREF0381_0280 [Lachnoanaerobaculum saburreum DSM 3986]|uniref:Uncharacterized protein n=1 Tax=Lachnoanaerobaculum saburreum DSM 3986 TaxID=887325 RepID=E6LJT5_9FIRM|nr:hypothetical protein HMPREF0381_0280 [Lachnoanaerobaculum saburreum DSM 3986]